MAKASWAYIGCSDQSVPRFPNTAIRCSAEQRTPRPPSVVTANEAEPEPQGVAEPEATVAQRPGAARPGQRLPRHSQRRRQPGPAHSEGSRLPWPASARAAPPRHSELTQRPSRTCRHRRVDCRSGPSPLWPVGAAVTQHRYTPQRPFLAGASAVKSAEWRAMGAQAGLPFDRRVCGPWSGESPNRFSAGPQYPCPLR